MGINLIFSTVFACVLFTAFFDYAFAEPTIILTPHDNVIMCESLLISLENQSTLAAVVQNLDNPSSSLDVLLNEDSVTMVELRPIPPAECQNISPLNPVPIPDDPNIPNILAAAGHRIQVTAAGIEPMQVQVISITNPNIDGLRQVIILDYYDEMNCETNDDIDQDRICDSWETDNILRVTDPNGLVIYEYVCDENTANLPVDPETPHPKSCGNDLPDVFLEIDWMEGHEPDPIAIQQVINAFDDPMHPNPVRLHIQIDKEFAIGHREYVSFPGYDWEHLPQWKGFDQLKGSEFGTDDERSTERYGENWDATQPHRIGKHQAFHYGVFAHMRYGGETTSGVAETPGNDFMVTMGSFTGSVGSTDQQSGTLMHELGHNLGLNHGGSTFDPINYKPNYLSVMSYSKQFSDYDSERVLTFSRQSLGQNPSQLSYLEDSLWEMDPSYQYRGMEIYSGVRENVIYSCPDGQLGWPFWWAGTRINWNCDGIWDTQSVDGNINHLDGTSPVETTPGWIDGHNDWVAGDEGSQGLIFDFSETSNYVDGKHVHTADKIPAVQALGPPGIPPGFKISDLVRLCADAGIPASQCRHQVDDFPYKSQGINEITINDVTRHRIDSLLLLYQTGLIIPEDAYGSNGISFEPYENSDGQIINVDFTPKTNIHPAQMVQSRTAHDYLHLAIGEAIVAINHHDIKLTQEKIQTLDSALEKSLNKNIYKSMIEPITTNLLISYDKALDFTPTTIHEVHKPSNKPIIDPEEVKVMVQTVEDFVIDIKISDQDGDGVPDTFDENYIPPQADKYSRPYKMYVEVGKDITKVKCNGDRLLFLHKTNELPVCIFPKSVDALKNRGFIVSILR